MEEQRICEKCKVIKDLNVQNFTNDIIRTDGTRVFRKTCRSCRSNKKKKYEIVEVGAEIKTHTCTKCGEILELNTENFHKKTSKKSGYASHCICCDKKERTQLINFNEFIKNKITGGLL